MKIRKNIMLLAFIAAALVLALALLFPQAVDLVFALGGAVIGGLCSVMKDIANDPEPTVPASSHDNLISKLP